MSQRITQQNSGLELKEWKTLKNLSNPVKIQDYLNSLEFDFSPGEEMDRSVRGTLKSGRTDCAGAAIFAAAAFWVNGGRPIVLDLVAAEPDFDHVIALFQLNKSWGAISKTNHAVLRYREPVYKNTRELAMSYFHEYFLNDGKKTLRSFSKPFDLSKYGTSWLTDGDKLIDIIYDLDQAKHEKVATPKEIRHFRKADKIEIEAAKIEEYPSPDNG